MASLYFKLLGMRRFDHNFDIAISNPAHVRACSLLSEESELNSEDEHFEQRIPESCDCHHGGGNAGSNDDISKQDRSSR